MFSVSWQAHGGEPVLDAFWAASFGARVAITASLHGSLRFWSTRQLLEAASQQRHGLASAALTCPYIILSQEPAFTKPYHVELWGSS